MQCAGFFTIYLYVSNGSPRAVVQALSLALIGVSFAEVLRFNSSTFERVYERCLGFLMRESEKVRHCHTPYGNSLI